VPGRDVLFTSGLRKAQNYADRTGRAGRWATGNDLTSMPWSPPLRA